MPFLTYKLMHLIALIALFMGIGALITLRKNQVNNGKMLAMGFHGLALFFLLFSGFGMLARMQITTGMPRWVIAKLFIWVALAVFPFFLKRKPGRGTIFWWICWIFASFAAYFALYKP